MIKLSFCQNDWPRSELFWQKDSLITHILFELWLITLLWIVSVFLTQTLKGFSGNFQISKLEFTKSIQGKLIKVGHQSFLEAMLNDLFNGLDWNNVQAFSHVTRQVSQVFFILGGFQLLDLIIKDLKSHMTC